MIGGVKRPLFAFCGSFVLASFFLSLFSSTERLIFIFIFALATIAVALLSIFKKMKNGLFLILTMSCLLSSVFVFARFDIKNQKIEPYYDTDVDNIVCTVNELHCSYSYYSSFTVKVKSINDEKIVFNALVETQSETTVEKGQIIRIENGNLQKVGGNEIKYYGTKIDAVITPNGQIEIESENGFITFFDRLSKKLSARFRIVLGVEEGGLTSALLLGSKENLPSGTETSFGWLGISHLLAVSGLHLTILIGFIDYILKRISRNAVIPFVAEILFIAFYAMLTGLRLSVLRAGIMLFLYLTSRFIGRQSDSFTSLSLALSVIVVAFPDSLKDCGFLLSAVSTLVLIVFSQNKIGFIKNKVLNFIISTVFTSVAILWATLPIQWMFFGSVSLWSPLSNLIFIPLTSVVLFLSPIVLIFSYTPIASIVGYPLKMIAGVILKLSDKLAVSAGKPISINYSFTPICFVISILVFIGIIVLFKDKKRRILMSTAPQLIFIVVFGLSVFVYSSFLPSVSLGCANIGTNDYVFAKSEGNSILFDVSNASYSSLRTACEDISDKINDTSPNVLALTHYHSKHVSTVCRFIDDFRPELLLLPEPNGDEEQVIYDRIREYAKEKNVNVLDYDSNNGDNVDFYGLSINIYPSSDVKNSTHKTLRIDIEGEGENISYRSVSSIDENNIEKLTIVGSHGSLKTNAVIHDDSNLIAINQKVAKAIGINSYCTPENSVSFYKGIKS